MNGRIKAHGSVVEITMDRKPQVITGMTKFLRSITTDLSP